jgi:hypothetical protein
MERAFDRLSLDGSVIDRDRDRFDDRQMFCPLFPLSLSPGRLAAVLALITIERVNSRLAPLLAMRWVIDMSLLQWYWPSDGPVEVLDPPIDRTDAWENCDDKAAVSVSTWLKTSVQGSSKSVESSICRFLSTPAIQPVLVSPIDL